MGEEDHRRQAWRIFLGLASLGCFVAAVASELVLSYCACLNYYARRNVTPMELHVLLPALIHLLGLVGIALGLIGSWKEPRPKKRLSRVGLWLNLAAVVVFWIAAALSPI